MNLVPEDWGFETAPDGGLVIGGVRATDAARRFGTPLHVVDEAGLLRRAADFRRAFERAWPGEVSVHYAMKCNSAPGVVARLLQAGLLPEAGTPFEWELARRLGAAARDVVVNGPHKGALLETAVAEGALLVADGPLELDALERAARGCGRRARVLLRVNPDCVPHGMNGASATGSRRHSVFGFDRVSREVPAALARIKCSPHLDFEGFHCHAGTGIRRAADYVRPMRALAACAGQAAAAGLAVRALDVGGGFGVPTSREFDTGEFLLYQALGVLPRAPEPAGFPRPADFAAVVARTLEAELARLGLPLPRLLVEPGRSVVSGAGALLLTVGSLKTRAGVGTWAITDGGTGTVAFPLYYEYHEVLLCRAARAPRTRRYSLVGPACFSADWIYRNKRMPQLAAGDVLAVCDAGAYFLAQESNFGFPRPAMAGLGGGDARLMRRRETFEDMVARDAGLEVCDERDRMARAAR
jgi:diaminopimelate decarboxylase